MAQVLCVSHQIDQVQEERCYSNVFVTQVTGGRALEDIRQPLLPLPTSVSTTDLGNCRLLSESRLHRPVRNFFC
jgi:hypothetical protein